MTKTGKATTAEKLETNNITILRDPDRKRWPEYVEDRCYHLCSDSSFAGLVPFGHKILERPGVRGKLPESAFSFKLKGNRVLRDDKDVHTEILSQSIWSACEYQEECNNLLDNGLEDEFSWVLIWHNMFFKWLTLEKGADELRLVVDKLFSKFNTTGELTKPKPDITLAFSVDWKSPGGNGGNRFDPKDLKDFRLKHAGVLLSPLNDDHQACFPWGIFESKSMKNRAHPYVECQAANAASACLKMLEKLESSTAQARGVGEGEGGPKIAIPCFTNNGHKWDLWLFYKSGNDCKGNNTYELGRIFSGDMSDLWSCIQLVHIVQRLREWAVGGFKKCIAGYLNTSSPQPNSNRDISLPRVPPPSRVKEDAVPKSTPIRNISPPKSLSPNKVKRDAVPKYSPVRSKEIFPKHQEVQSAQTAGLDDDDDACYSEGDSGYWEGAEEEEEDYNHVQVWKVANKRIWVEPHGKETAEYLFTLEGWEPSCGSKSDTWMTKGKAQSCRKIPNALDLVEAFDKPTPRGHLERDRMMNRHALHRYM